MINNKGLLLTFVAAVASIFTISLYWNDFAGTLKVNVSMDRQGLTTQKGAHGI